MKVSVLSSGSKGNSTYVETKNHKILIDLGNSCLYIEKALKNNASYKFIIYKTNQLIIIVKLMFLSL